MFKNIHKIIIISSLTFSIFALNNFTSVNTYAVDQSVVVNNIKGINIRDKNCNIIGKAGYGQQLNLEPGPSYQNITCNINGKKMTFSSYFPIGTTPGFVAQDFVSPIIFGGNIDFLRLVKDKNGLEYNKVYLNATNNLNLRDQNCKISKNVTQEVALFIPPVGSGGNAFICRVGNKFYDMRPVTESTNANSPVYFAAEVFLR